MGRTRNPKSNTGDDEISEDDLSEEGRLIVKIIERKFDTIVTKLTEELKNRDCEVNDLRSEVNQLRIKLGRMEEKIDDADAYERRDTIILSGNDVPSATQGEIVSDIVCGVVRDRLKLEMDVTDISAAHRLGPKPKSQGPDRRKIIVKLCRRERKYDLITACKQTKPPNLFINENLTPTRNKILFSLRRGKKKFPNIVAACSSHDGKVYAWIKPPNPDAPSARNSKIFINTQDQLEDFCRKSLKVQIEELHK